MKNTHKNSPASWFEAHWFRKEKAKAKKGKSTSRWVLLFSLIFYTLISFLSLSYIEAKVAAMPYFQMREASLRITQLPSWLVPFTQAIEPIDLTPIPNIFKPDSASAIAEAYLRNPWVKEVVSIRKKYPQTMEVELLLRKPIALLVCNEGYVPIDAQGVYLPLLSEESESSEALPKLEMESSILPQAGQKCTEGDILQSLRTISFLTSHGAWNLVPVQSLRIETMPGSSHKILSLVLENSIRILWEDLATPNFFVPPSQKMKALKALHHTSSKENWEKILEVDLRFGYIILRQESPLFPKTKKI